MAFDSDSFQIYVDSSASSSTTVEKLNFTTETQNEQNGVLISDISLGLKAVGYDSVKQSFLNDQG